MLSHKVEDLENTIENKNSLMRVMKVTIDDHDAEMAEVRASADAREEILRKVTYANFGCIFIFLIISV